jgi:hypothetical protein
MRHFSFQEAKHVPNYLQLLFQVGLHGLDFLRMENLMEHPGEVVLVVDFCMDQ